MKRLKVITKGVDKRIRQTREDLGWTQAQFGGFVGISEGYVGMIENGRRKPSQALIIAIAAKFDVNENWLRVGKHS
jgi:transcriptional regulator with XRE-family HTH domain